MSQNEAFKGISRKAHQVSASNLHTFSIKCTARTFNLAICVVNDYKHKTYLTIDYLKYDFIMHKSTFRKITQVLEGPFILTSRILVNVKELHGYFYK